MYTSCGTEAETPLAITLPELARQLGIPRKQARELAETGAIPSFQMDGKVYVLKRDLGAFIEKRNQAPGIAPTSGSGSKGVSEYADTRWNH